MSDLVGFHENLVVSAGKEKLNYEEIIDYVDRRVYRIKEDREKITTIQDNTRKFTIDELIDIYKELKVHKKYQSTVNFLAYISNMTETNVK